MASPLTFTLPEELVARMPPERRGIPRDGVRLLVLYRGSGRTVHTTFERLAEFLRPGDLLVFNTSRTMPASLCGCSDPSGPCVELRIAEHLADDSWRALVLCSGGEPFACELRPGMRVAFGRGLTATI